MSKNIDFSLLSNRVTIQQSFFLMSFQVHCLTKLQFFPSFSSLCRAWAVDVQHIFLQTIFRMKALETFFSSDESVS